MMDSEDGQLFIKNLAQFVRTHEKALANALQLRRQQNPRNGQTQSLTNVGGPSSGSPNPSSSSLSTASTSSTLAAALSLPYLNFASHNIKPAKLSLTPHHLFYLLSRFEDLGIPVGPMNVRLENLHADTASNYVSFLSQSRRSNARGSDRASIHSVSSVRSVMSGMSTLWSGSWLSGGSSAAKSEKQRAQIQADLTYLYSAFTKIPCLRLAPDRRARLIEGYEEFPFDTAVPLVAFKNISALEISDIDIRQFYGWDRLADQLRSLTVKRAGVDDPADLLINIVLDDMDKRRRRSSKAQLSPTTTWATPSSPKRSPTLPHATLVKSNSAPGSPDTSTSKLDEPVDVPPASLVRSGSEHRREHRRSHSKDRPRSNSPVRPPSARAGSSHGHTRGTYKVKRSGSGSSHSSLSDSWYTHHRGSSSNLLSMSVLPPSKWRFLKHLSLADNALTFVSAESLIPLANTLHSLDLSSNLFAQIPDSLASLTALRALNLSNCMIDSLHSLTRNPLPAITALNLRANRLQSLAGVERLYPLERLDLRDNKLTDPTELARLTGMPEIREIWVSGNPFTKTHSDYRVTIFNLFRKSPGYTEDILIDSTGPGYNERRQLVDRVAERPNVPVVRPAPVDVGPTPITITKPAIIYGDAPKAPAVLRKERPGHNSSSSTATSEVHKSSRRRKTQRRRIVDLSTNDAAPVQPRSTVRFVPEERPLPPLPIDEPVASTPKPVPMSDDVPAPIAVSEPASVSSEHTVESDSGYGVSPKSPAPLTKLSTPTRPAVPPKHVPITKNPAAKNDIPHLDSSAMPQLSPAHSEYEPVTKIPSKEPTPRDWNISGELYRQKIEALRNEVGNGWLTALGDDGWDLGKNGQLPGPDFAPPGALNSSTPRVASQQSIHSGRTLG